MGLFSREQDRARPRWVDDGRLGWSPEEPLELEKRLKSRHDAHSISSQLKRGMVSMFRRTRSGSARVEPAPLSARFGNGNRDGKSPSGPRDSARPVPPSSASPVPKRTLPNSAPDWLLRLGIGLAQGVALALLFLAHDQNIWPGSEPAFSTALLLAGIMAPLALLEGFDQVEPKLLLLWSGTLGFLIATLGLWQQWRGGLEVMPVVTIALLVLLAHITARAALREMRLWPGYDAWTETAWTIGARLLVWGTIAMLAFVVIAAFNGILGWVLAQFGAGNAATLISMPLLGMASAAGFAVAADGWVQKRTRSTLLTSCAAALPILSAAALALLGLYLAQAKIPHGILLGLAAALVIAAHAFDWRLVPRRWCRIAQGLFGFVILESTLIAGLDIHARVAAHGWTDMRIYAAVAACVLALYGLVYLAESFTAMRGARTLHVMDRAIPLLALLVALTCLMLSTPLADPLALAVKSQVGRFERDPAKFDFSWLKNQGGRFGQEALARLDSRPAPAPVIPASSVSPAPAPVPTVQPRSEAPPRPIATPEPAAPAPKPEALPAVLHLPPPAAASKPAPQPAAARPQADPEPAGDIVQHTAGDFPVELLAQNWSRTDAAPCLTKASIACDVWFLDLDGDGRKEILFAYGDGTRVKANVMRQTRGRWIEAAAVASAPCQGLLARVRSQTGGLLPGWRGALRTSLRQRPGAPPVELPCPRG